jgi:hypothetical protein
LLDYFIQIIPPPLLAARGAMGLFQSLTAPVGACNGLAILAAAAAIVASFFSASWYYLEATSAEKCGRLYGLNPFA